MASRRSPDRRGAGPSRRELLRGATALLLLGCGREGGLRPGVPPPALGGPGYAGPPLELAFWNGFTGGDGPPMRGLVARFNAEHPRIQVRMNAIRWDELYRKLPVAVACGRGPDVAALHQHQLPTAAARGVVLPLDALLAEWGLGEGDFLPAAWRAGTWAGQRYGLPLDVHPLALFFNRSALERAGVREPPATGAALEEALARLRRSGFAHPFWMPTLWPAHFIFESLLWQLGGAPFSADAAHVTFAGEAGEGAVRWMTAMYREGHSPRSVALDSQWNAFSNGTNALTFDGLWRVNDLARIPGGAGVAPLPQVGAARAAWANSHNLVLCGRPALEARRIQAGMVFLAWLSEHSLAWGRAGQVPARNAVRESAEYAALAALAPFVRAIADARLVPPGPGIGDLQDDAVVFAVDGVLRSREPRAALERAQARADAQLQRLRGQFEEAR